jgi:hypothetical protein
MSMVLGYSHPDPIATSRVPSKYPLYPLDDGEKGGRMWGDQSGVFICIKEWGKGEMSL